MWLLFRLTRFLSFVTYHSGQIIIILCCNNWQLLPFFFTSNCVAHYIFRRELCTSDRSDMRGYFIKSEAAVQHCRAFKLLLFWQILLSFVSVTLLFIWQQMLSAKTLHIFVSPIYSHATVFT